MAREHPLVAAVARYGGGFVSDTAPLVYHVEHSGPRRAREAVDALFARVAKGELGCLISTLSAGELLVHPHRIGLPALGVVDGFLRSPSVGLVPPSLEIAHGAARLVARRTVPRLADAIIAATAFDLRLPLITTDRRLARAVGALLVQDHLAAAT
jgi:predicted nucleic acid-binding protein